MTFCKIKHKIPATWMFMREEAAVDHRKIGETGHKRFTHLSNKKAIKSNKKSAHLQETLNSDFNKQGVHLA